MAGGLALIVRVAVVLGSTTPILVIPAFVVFTDFWFIRTEERSLQETFGAEFTAYKARVRRWL